MEPDASYSEQMDYVSEVVEKVGHSVQNIQETEDGEPVIAVASIPNQRISYEVALTEGDLPYVILRFRYSLLYDLSATLMQEKGMIPEGEQPNVQLQEGMTELNQIQNKDKQTYATVLQELDQILAENSEVYYIPKMDEANNLKGFQTNRKAFVFDENFSLADFDEAARAVVYNGVKARKHLRSRFGITSQNSAFSAGYLSDRGGGDDRDPDGFGREDTGKSFG